MIPRTVMDSINRTINTKPVTLITGARQVGKTFLCREISKERGIPYISLVDRQNRDLAMNDPDAFLKMHGTPLIIDEVQYAPALFESIEAIVDKRKFENGDAYGMYILTGSQAYNLMEGVTQSMAGRVGIIRMSTLSISEIAGREEVPFTPEPESAFKRSSEIGKDLPNIYEDIVRGSYPELHSNPDILSWEFYGDYVDTYVNKDVSQIINVKDQMKFINFMQVLASMTGQELVYENISKSVGIDVKTMKQWISVLIAGDIVFLLEPYSSTSTVKRVMKKPKIFFRDTGLACYLARITDAKTLTASYLKGPMAETYIVNEIMKTYANRRVNAAFYYFRDYNGVEVDLIIQKDGRLNLIECKGGIDYTGEDTKAFSRLGETREPIGSSCIVCMSELPYPVKDGIYAIPVTSI